MKKSKLLIEPKHYGERIYDEMPILKKHLRDFFPLDAAVREHVANLPTPEKAPKNVYTAQYLPYHFKDIPWMTEYTAEVMARVEPNQKIDPYTLQSMVSGYEPFKRARYAYKQRLIKAQIQYMMRADKANGVMSVDPAVLRTRPDYDKLFRTELVNAMSKLKIEPRFIEIGLETNADLWRQPTMMQTFETLYYPHGTVDPKNIKRNHWTYWHKQRENEYYQDHKESVEQWGLETRNMDLTQEELQEVNKQLQYYTKLHDRTVIYPRDHQPTATAENDRSL